MLLCELEFSPRWVLCYPAKCGPFNVIKAHSEVYGCPALLHTWTYVLCVCLKVGPIPVKIQPQSHQESPDC